MKSQDVRLFDVFVLGPFMIWAGAQLQNDVARAAMIAAGAGTIVYNWKNYMLAVSLRDKKVKSNAMLTADK